MQYDNFFLPRIATCTCLGANGLRYHMLF